MEYLLIFPALLVYTFACGFVIHLISDRHNRRERRRITRLYNGRERRRITRLYNRREAMYRVRNTK